MELRECAESDVRDVYDLVCELKESELDYRGFEAAFGDKINDKTMRCILAAEGGKAIGFLSLNIDYQLHHAAKVATIEELVVNAEHRGRGVGGLLLESAVQHAKDAKCDVIELTSGIARERAHKFYIKNGFAKSSLKFVMGL